MQRIVTNRLIEKAKKNGQSGLFSADKLPFHDFHCCCCYSHWCLFNYKITIIVLQFATQDSDVLFFFFFFFKKIAGPSKQSPSHHLNYSVCIFFFCFTLIFNFIANQRILKGKDKNLTRLRHSFTQSQINKGSVNLTVACPATAIAKHQMAKKKCKVGSTPVAKNYRENMHHAWTVFIKCVGLKTRFKLRGLRFWGLCFRGLHYSAVCVF